MSLEPGARIGDYEVLAVLGAGGMGKVYKVRNVISDRIEAIKVLLPNLSENPELAERFLREIKVQAALTHPNIASLHTAVNVDNQLLMVMEFVEGYTLESYLSQGRIPIQHAVGYMSQVLSALSYAHKQGVVHRDIKPANMMVTPQGVVKLMDFGIARIGADRSLTQTGNTVGSLFYMSPEQINGSPDVDARSDIYSLGVSMYQMLTGKRPFDGDSDFKIMAAHMQQKPVPPIELDPDLPAILNEVIMLAITRDPAKRFQSADAMLAALSSLNAPPKAAPAAAKPVESKAPVVPQPVAMEKSSSKRGLYMLIGSLATVAVLVVGAMQLPKYFGAKADDAAQAKPLAEVSVQPTKPPDPQPPTTDTQKPQADTPAQTATTTANRPQIAPTTIAQKPAAQARPIDTAQQQPPPPVREPEPVVMPPQNQPQQQLPPTVAQQPPQQQPAQNNQDEGLRQRALTRQSNRLAQLEPRTGAVHASLKRLQDAQARSGLGLRGDMSAASQRLEVQLNMAAKAIQDGNPAVAKNHLDLAERALETLEKFLGL